MTIETNNKEQVRGKKVLLFSCGMDCLCLNQIYKPDILLHINYGGVYGEQEKKSLNNLIKCKAIKKDKVISVDIGKWLGLRERDDLIIPSRNIYFVTLAADYGETIWLASVRGDRSFDKDNKFYELMTTLLNHTWDQQHWTEKRVFNISSPIKHLTKTELIKEYLKAGGKKKWLLESYSCYSGKDKPCGKCKPCFRKAVALFNTEVRLPKGYFLENPRKNEGIISMKEKIVKGKYRGIEDREICDYMRWNYIGK